MHFFRWHGLLHWPNGNHGALLQSWWVLWSETVVQTFCVCRLFHRHLHSTFEAGLVVEQLRNVVIGVAGTVCSFVCCMGLCSQCAPCHSLHSATLPVDDQGLTSLFGDLRRAQDYDHAKLWCVVCSVAPACISISQNGRPFVQWDSWKNDSSLVLFA